MRTKAIMAIVGLCLIGYAWISLSHNVIAKQPAADSDLVIKVYRVGDQSVWSTSGDFDPDLLVCLIQGTINPKSWGGGGGTSTMPTYAENASLVVSTSADNHKEIVDLLDDFRDTKITR